MSKLTLFLLLALTNYVINDLKAGNITLQTCNDLNINNVEAIKQDLEEDYCSALRTSGIDNAHCCFFEGSSDTLKGCYEITDDQYENVVRFKKYISDQLGDDEIEIHCSGKFISFSMLAVLALLF